MEPLVSEVHRVSERIDSMMVEVARDQEAMNWREMLHLLEDVVNNPRDIALAVRLAGAGGNIKGKMPLVSHLDKIFSAT